MLKIHVFGSSAGTEPQKGRHHTSWALEYAGALYWFDAGECCYHTASEMGLDLQTIRSIAISHPHIDHCGGLPNLLWSISKLRRVRQQTDALGISLFLPKMQILECVRQWLECLGEKELNYDIAAEEVTERKLFDDGRVSIEARKNFHLGTPADGVFRSFSYRIKADGKTIVFSGDVKSYADMGEWLDGCDLLLMETGHHKASEVCAALRSEKRDVRDILFVHSGRELLNDYANALARAEAAWGAPLKVAYDGFTLQL